MFFDGDKIIENAPSLGLLGDEGSGNYFGKKVINYYFNGLFDEELKSKFEQNYECDLMEIKEIFMTAERMYIYQNFSLLFQIISLIKLSKI